MHLIIAVAEALKFDVKSLVINRSSIRKSREKLREARALNIKQIFKNTKLNAASVHFDGKLLPSINHEKVERLPIVLNNGDTEKLLGIQSLDDGRGRTQANAIFEILED